LIMRGASGSGKTTLARQLMEKNGGITFTEADLRMVNSNGEYEFDPKKLTACHGGCITDIEDAMKRSEKYIVVSNTATQYWEMFQYVRLAKEYGYSVEFAEPLTEWRRNPQILAQKNAHNVPFATIKNQVENLKRNPTLPTPQMIAAILATGGYRSTLYRQGINQTPWKFIYYGINGKLLLEFTNKLKNILGEQVYPTYSHNKHQRDGGPNENGEEIYHISLVGQPVKDEEQRGEYFNILRNIRTKPKYVGIGKAEGGGNLVYYVVVEWKEINEVRAKFKLPLLDLHVTLGFLGSDVHGVSKGLQTVIL